MAEGFTTPTKDKNKVFSIPPSPFLKRLGYGTGVTVYKFERSPEANTVRSPWALKMVNKNAKSTKYGQQLCLEANLLKKMKHPNIVGFRAFTKTNVGSECLAMESCTISLANLIEKRSEDELLAIPTNNIMTFILNIAKALDYLHERVLLLHGDIKSPNVLVVNDFEVCKLCDFGVSLPLNKTGELNKVIAGEEAEYVGTLPWSAPEVIAEPQIITSKADIFAFGLVIWEMLALDIPHSLDITDDLVDPGCAYKDCSDLFGTRPKIPFEKLGNNPEEYNYPLEIFHCCTEQNPCYRPKAHHLALSAYEMINNNKIV